ncbi:hypothetical protein AB1283_12385 [Bacillus sp. S13(2024)]|uniref:hypothetical protein n=1 Tax=unclassified Bacillus (in: firmicutes) TaxID=185979 RepID=UPI003D20A2FC
MFIYLILFSAIPPKNYEGDRRKVAENADEIKETIKEPISKATGSVARIFFAMEQLAENLRNSLAYTV